MAHVKWNMACGIALTNQDTGETIFIPLEGMEVDNAYFNQVLSDPASADDLCVEFFWDENNKSVRAKLKTCP